MLGFTAPVIEEAADECCHCRSDDKDVRKGVQPKRQQDPKTGGRYRHLQKAEEQPQPPPDEFVTGRIIHGA